MRLPDSPYKKKGVCSMEIIAKLCEMIEEELEDACKYAECALNNKETDSALAEAFHKLSLAEMDHMDILHKQVVRKIEEYRKEHGEPPKEMLFLYDYLHKQHMNKAKEVKVLQGMYSS